ncbi:hypothetical protein Q8A67_020240 [Cirrhinus molitorella]|uniref:Protein kinase domain-containing protein n=1 Tax=Cirrhinus molitorella TaxID=172907 RepID=A0AA88P4W6_9TELE|nr:hypothetical protein Q8A67_020240 [Cirrhinus molitorella]
MGQRATKVVPITIGEVYDQHLSTPPKPSTNTEVQHLHPRDETPVGAGGGGGGEGGEEEEEEKGRKEAGRVEEKRKRKKWWLRLRSFFKAAKKHQESSSGQGEVEVEQQQQDEGKKRKVAWAGRSSDDYIFSRYSVGDVLGKGGYGVVYEGRRLRDGLKVPVTAVQMRELCVFTSTMTELPFSATMQAKDIILAEPHLS